MSTGSGTLSRLVHLHIAVPEAFILGADEHHVDAGSSINLVCIIEKVSQEYTKMDFNRIVNLYSWLESKKYIRVCDIMYFVPLL